LGVGLIVEYYEYMWCLLVVCRIFRGINEGVRKGKTPVGVFGIMHADVLECVLKMNGTIFGTPVVVTFISGYIADVVIVTYYHVLFQGIFMKYKKNTYVSALSVVLKLLDLSVLYWICSYTAKEV